MKTLVIHPEDPTTDFLSAIYSDRPDWKVVRTFYGKSKLVEMIKEHDRIVMLGHGTEYGLLGGMGFIVTSSLVYLLRQKQCVCIWCNADVFVKKYDIKGFYTGMIISEYEEALLYSIHEFSYSDISESNIVFAKAIKESICKDDMLSSVLASYDSETNCIIKFNKQNIYHR